MVMKKYKVFFKRVLSAVLLITVGILPTKISAKDSFFPYALIDGGCVVGADITSSRELANDFYYYRATVSSHIQGLLTNSAIPYEVYGAIGSEDTAMFVYSIGDNDDLDYARHPVLSIVEEFEKNNPAWDALVATNGDFVDIETKLTPSMGEPEGVMIQNGSVYKGTFDPVPGRGIVGVRTDGSVVYSTAGQGYTQNGYGVGFGVSSKYLVVEVIDKETDASLAEYITCFGAHYDTSLIYLSTPDTEEMDLSSRTVYVIKCDTYRHSHVLANGVDGGTLGNYVYGEIVEIREGTKQDKPDNGYVFISVPKRTDVEHLKLGAIVECQLEMRDEWTNVVNALGFKQQILAEGNVLLKNCYGTYNQSGDPEETLRWTADIYDYPHCWKNRTLLGFKADGTPVLLVVARSSHDGAYHNLGASYYESGEQLKALGCVNGFLLDGGGSSTFVIRNEDGTFSNAFVGEGNGRAVGNAVILAVRDKNVPLSKDEETTAEVTTALPIHNDTASNNESKESSVFLIIAGIIVTASAIGFTTAIVQKKKKTKPR